MFCAPSSLHKELELAVDGSHVELPEQFFVLACGINVTELTEDVRKAQFKGFPTKLDYLLSPVRQNFNVSHVCLFLFLHLAC